MRAEQRDGNQSDRRTDHCDVERAEPDRLSLLQERQGAEGRGPDEQSRSCALLLQGAEYLPLRTFTDADLGARPVDQSDPVLGLLAALGGLPPGWRSLRACARSST